MLTKVRIQGYKSLKDVEVELRPLNVLIGPNGSGKSNFMDSLVFLHDAVAVSLEEAVYKRGGAVGVQFAGAEPDAHVTFLYDFDNLGDRPGFYSFKLRLGGGFAEVDEEHLDAHRAGDVHTTITRHFGGNIFQVNEGGSVRASHNISGERVAAKNQLTLSRFSNDPGIRYFTDYLQAWILYTGFDVGPGSKVRQPQLLQDGLCLTSTGENLASVCYNIREHHRAEWDEIIGTLQVAYPPFDRIAFPAEGRDGRINIRWFEKPFDKHEGFSANSLPDGILRFLCLVAVLMSPKPAPLILIDEPEIGLHPHLIQLVAELMQGAAEKTQLVVATHSPELVSALEPDDILVVESHEGGTTMERLSGADLNKWMKDFSLGELWLSGSLGGRP